MKVYIHKVTSENQMQKPGSILVSFRHIQNAPLELIGEREVARDFMPLAGILVSGGFKIFPDMAQADHAMAKFPMA